METVEPTPVPDSVAWNFWASARVLTGEVFHMNTTLTSESRRPIQLSSAVLKRTPCVPSFSSSGMVGRADADDGAVLGRDIEDRVHREEAAGAGLVLRHDRRLSRNVLAEMTGEEPPQCVVAAAGRIADDEIDGLAGVELLRG